MEEIINQVRVLDDIMNCLEDENLNILKNRIEPNIRIINNCLTEIEAIIKSDNVIKFTTTEINQYVESTEKNKNIMKQLLVPYLLLQFSENTMQTP